MAVDLIKEEQTGQMSVTPQPVASPLSEAEVRSIRADFPVLSQQVNGYPLVYLDNGATTQKPQAVIDRMTRFYSEEYGTVRRGVYALSAKATEAFDQVRTQVGQFLNAASEKEIVFTRGTTEAINLVAFSLGNLLLKAGDQVLISGLEHHANIVPWQEACVRTGATLVVIPVLDDGSLDLAAFETLLTPKTKIMALTHVSNALGTVNPVAEMIKRAHAVGAVVLIDGAQGAPHMPVDVQALDCDFYAFSSHKVYGPSGVGVLYGKYALLEQMPPYQTGGDMILSVTFEKTTFAKPPARFEAGTPAIAEVIGLGAALDYVTSVGLDRIALTEEKLRQEATDALSGLPGLRIIGSAPQKSAVLSFYLDYAHPHDIGTILDQSGVAIRAGHHCAQPVMQRYGVPATARASFSFYNTPDEIARLVSAIGEVRRIFTGGQ